MNTEENPFESEDETSTPTDEEWANRRLCSDGNCIGVIGPDGRCKECGKPYGGDDLPPSAGPSPTPDAEALAEDDSETDAVEADEAVVDDGSWENRRLCSDGNCIGVIGPDGRCKVCGKPYEGD